MAISLGILTQHFQVQTHVILPRGLSQDAGLDMPRQSQRFRSLHVCHHSCKRTSALSSQQWCPCSSLCFLRMTLDELIWTVSLQSWYHLNSLYILVSFWLQSWHWTDLCQFLRMVVSAYNFRAFQQPISSICRNSLGSLRLKLWMAARQSLGLNWWYKVIQHNS